MLALLKVCSLTLFLGLFDGARVSVEIPSAVRQAVQTAHPDQLTACLKGLGARGLRAAWAVHLGLAVDPLAEQGRREGDPWSLHLDGAEAVDLIDSLREVLPKEIPAHSCRMAIARISRLGDASVIEPMVDLVLCLPDGALQGQRTLTWVAEAFVEVGRDAPFAAKPLERAYERLPLQAHAALDIALLAAGSSHPLGSWDGRDLSDRAVQQRIRLLETVAPSLGTAPVLATLEDLSTSHTSVEVRSSAARCLGAMEATSMISHLVDLSFDGDEMASKAAMEALVHCARVRWPRTPEEWVEWWELEERWMRQELANGIDALLNDEPGTRAAGLRVLLEHPAASSVMAEAIAEAALWTTDEAFGRRVILGLKALPGPEPRAALARIAEEGSPGLSELAAGALASDR